MMEGAFVLFVLGSVQIGSSVFDYPVDFGRHGSFTGNLLITGSGIVKGEDFVIRAADQTKPILQIGDGVTSTGPVEIAGIRFTGADYHSPLPDGGVFSLSDAIYIVGATHVVFNNISCKNSLRDCINLDSTPTQPTYDVHINDLRCDYPKRDCIHAVMGGTATHLDPSAYVTAIYVDNFFLNAEASLLSHSVFTDGSLQMSNGYIEPGGIATLPVQLGSQMLGGIEIDVNASCKMPNPIQPWTNVFVDGNNSPQTTVLVKTQNYCSGANFFSPNLFMGGMISIPGLYQRSDGSTVSLVDGLSYLNNPRLLYPMVEQSLLFNDHSQPGSEPGFDDPSNQVALYRYGSVDAGAMLNLQNAGFKFPMTAKNPLQCGNGGGCGSLWRDDAGELRWEPGTWSPSDTDPGPLMREVPVPTKSTSSCAVGQTATDGRSFYLCVAPNSWKQAVLGDF